MSSDAEKNYQRAYALSLSDPDSFWGSAAEDLHWVKRWDKVLDTSRSPHGHWFVGGQLNTCYNALDRHVENGRGDHLALIYDSPVAGNKVASFSYRELKDLTAKFAGVLSTPPLLVASPIVFIILSNPEPASLEPESLLELSESAAA